MHKDKDEDYWKQVVFTDGVHFAWNNRSVDFVIRAPGQRFCSDCIKYVDRKLGLSIVFGLQLVGISKVH